MKNDAPLPGDTGDEVSVIIKALREADLRLEELTAGEVDTVLDREGRPFLLQRAQHQLRDVETAKRLAILNALPAQIALLDAQGRIVAANERWGLPTSGGSLRGPDYRIGRDYAQLCERGETDFVDAQSVAAGVRSVLAGSKTRFFVEYPSGPATDRRWFLLTISPLAHDQPGGAVVMHVDITEHKRDEEVVRRFAAAMDATADAIYLVDRLSMRFVHVNEAACRMQGNNRAGLLDLDPAVVFARSREDLELHYDRLICGEVTTEPLDMLQRRADGSKVWLELRCHAQCAGDRWTIVTLVRDITARKEAEIRIIHLNRVHAMLSRINTLIVRVQTRADLFTEACRIATEEGGFRMIWIGLVDRASMKITPVASIGAEEGFLRFVADELSLQEGAPLGNTMTARAIRGARPETANNVETNVDVLWHRKHFEDDIRSIAIFPLLIAQDVVGVVGLYAGESDFFQAGELKLLTEFTSDIAFAMDHIEKQEKLDYFAYYDVLTGLANRSLFLERTAQYIRSALIGRHQLALILIDLERFKNVNDSLGRPAGDILLRLVAQWLTQTVGDASLLARVGADHFAIVLPDLAGLGEVSQLIERSALAFLSHPFHLGDEKLRIAAKVGVALFPEHGDDADTLFKNAETALKRAKTTGDRYLCYAQKMTTSAAGRLTLENQLRQALERHEFVLHYQPKVNTVSGVLTGAEALLRWNDPRTGLVPPGRFIPILEETGLIHDVGRWALNHAIEVYRQWRKAGLGAVRIAVNVSPLQLRDRGFAEEIRRAIGDDPHAAGGLELEITEGLIMQDVRVSIAALREIRALGVHIAIDDFGTGFSSLSYLARLPVHTLKIDRSFVVDLAVGPEGLALVSTIIHLAHSLKLNVVAEGVETDEQVRLLRLLECDEMQGYLVSKAIRRESFEHQYLRPAPGECR